MIQTGYGPVALRRPREAESLTPAVGDTKERLRITKGWLGQKKGKDAKGQEKSESYRSKVKQAMMIGALKMELQDISVGKLIDTQSGLPFSPDQLVVREDAARQRLKGTQDGTGPVATRSLIRSNVLAMTGRKLKRHSLVKASKHPWASYKYRYWTLEMGIMRVYKSDVEGHAGEKHRIYDVRDAVSKFETRDMIGITEKFIDGMQARVRLQLLQRPHGPVFLYSKDVTEVKTWDRAIRMSKYLLNASDKEALAYVIGRVAGSSIAKGWGSLLSYYKEMEDTKRLMKILAMRLTKLDLSRGWNKIRLVFLQKTQADKLKKEQQEWAARFLSEKMNRLSTQSVRSPKLVRLSTINKVQTLFRHYRQDMIFDRAYPLGSNASTRVQQMLSGSTMMAAFSSLKADDVLARTLQGRGLEEFNAEPESFGSKAAPSYSEVNVKLSKMGLNVSESFTMLSFSEVEEAEDSVMRKAGWGHFVNLSQISSVVLHSERVMGSDGKEDTLPVDSCSGSWFTIYGPRVGWGRHSRSITDPQTRVSHNEVYGAKDGNALGKSLATGEKVQWFRMEVSVLRTQTPDLRGKLAEAGTELLIGDDAKMASQYGTRGTEDTTFLILTFLGRQFKAVETQGKWGKYTAEVPMADLASLDESELGIDVVQGSPENPDSHRTMWSAKVPLWKVFAPGQEIMPPQKEAPRQSALMSTLGFGGGALDTVLMGGGETKEVVTYSMTQSMRGLSHPTEKRIPMIHPPFQNSEIMPLKAYADVSVYARVQEAPMAKPCISPELQGRGPLTSLFTCQRAAWCAPTDKSKQYAPNFVELNIKELVFPVEDRVEVGRLFRYQLEARCNGILVATKPLHRATESWSKLMGLDTSRINFKGSLFLALPPGCWSGDKTKMPVVQLDIVRSTVVERPSFSYPELIQSRGKAVAGAPAKESVYHADLMLEGMLLDEALAPGTGVILSRTVKPAAANFIAIGELQNMEPQDARAVLLMDITLRDRDYARLHQASDSSQGVLCVGDKAMLKVEEPLTYPLDEVEFRRRAIPGDYDPKSSNGWIAPLRDPSLSHEYKQSGLDRLDPPVPYKQRFLSNNANDIIPHKYVMPRDEADFTKQCRPGVYWRIMEDMAAQKLQQGGAPAVEETQRKPEVVGRLSHLLKHIPVTVLAVYADQTCDVEIASNFLTEWETTPMKHFTIEGSVQVGDHTDTSAAAIRSAPVGAGDVGERLRKRVVLKGVSLGSVQSVQNTGFNVYDAALTSTDQIALMHPSKIGNDYNPRYMDGVVDAGRGQQGAYRIAAGPLPADANPASCTYEWSLTLNTKTEAEMFHFVTILRQAARLDLSEQLKKLGEFKQKSAFALNNRPYMNSDMFSSKSGHLEVILAGARHLRPTRVQQERDINQWVENTLKLEIQPKAIFTLLYTDEHGKEKELVHKGTKTQASPALTGSNPNWGEQEQFKGSGGWVFKSPLIDAAKMKNLSFRIEIESNTYEHMGLPLEKLGMVEMDVFGDPTKPGRHCFAMMKSSDSVNPLRVAGRLVLADLSKNEAIICCWPDRVALLRDTVTLKAVGGKAGTRASGLVIDEVSFFSLPADKLVYRPPGKWSADEISAPSKEVALATSHSQQITIQKMSQAELLTASEGLLGGSPSIDLSSPDKPFNNLWIGLSRKDTEFGELIQKAHGELHIMTLWKPSSETAQSRRLPKTVRGWQNLEFKQVMRGAAMHDPIYQLQTWKRGYDPNLYRDEMPPKLSEARASHVQALSESIPYIDCTVRQESQAWKTFMDRNTDPWNNYKKKYVKSGTEDRSLASWRDHWAKSTDKESLAMMYELDELLRRGVPIKQRHQIWMEVSRADMVQNMYTHHGAGSVAKKWISEGSDKKAIESEEQPKIEAAIKFYIDLVDRGKPYRNDAMWQLNEDLISASAWERPTHHVTMNQHFQRLKRAQDVCIALINFSREDGNGAPGDKPLPNFKDAEGEAKRVEPAGIAYCESLLVLAFFLLVAQGPQGENPREKKLAELQEEEVRAFWILYALIGACGSQPYRDYYGTTQNQLMCERRGATDDLLRLQCALQRFEPKLSIHLDALGFQLHSFFYTAFMRLFAFSLPVTSLFRFWDMLIGNACRPDLPSTKPARHGLIDLAWAGLQKTKAELMKCQSALEAQNCLVHFYEGICDPTELVELVAAAEMQLWDDPSYKTLALVGASPLHIMDYDRSVRHWHHYLLQFENQNRQVLQKVTRKDMGNAGAQVLAQGQSSNNKVVNDANTNSKNSPSVDSRVTTRTVMKIINALQHQFASEGFTLSQLGGLLRVMPQELFELEMGQETEATLASTALSFFGLIKDRFVNGKTMPPIFSVAVPTPAGAPSEPLTLDSITWSQHVQRCVGDAWTAHNSQIFDFFSTKTDRGEMRLSVNEFFTALICCSKGTVSEKAIALFYLYAFKHPSEFSVPHVQPVSHAAGNIIERNEGKSQVDEERLLKVPKDEEVKKMALRFEVFVFSGGAAGQKEVMLGEVFIPSLTPYMNAGSLSSEAYSGENARSYTIWGVDKRPPPGFAGNRQNQGNEAMMNEGVRPNLGIMNMEIKWMPTDPRKPEVGQLGITLVSIVFNSRVEAHQFKNPRVTVNTWGQNGSPQRLKRWDPRSLGKRITSRMAMAPPVGEYVDWEHTMRRDPMGKLWHKQNSGEHGWIVKDEAWKWDGQYGEQFSTDSFVFRKELCDKSATVGAAGAAGAAAAMKPNAISLQACRLLTVGILSRGLHPISHRQACLISDQIFNRAGAVPGLLDAIIVKDVGKNDLGMAAAKENFDKQGTKYYDVKSQLLKCHEIAVSEQMLNLDLLPSVGGGSGQPLNLKTLRIQDPLPGARKLLWIRLCRAGDGQRINYQIPVNENGDLAKGEICFDMPTDLGGSTPGVLTEGQVQMTVSKTEFVNCIIGNPLLSETLRQLSTTDNSTTGVPTGEAIKLDVTIADPTQEEADDDLMDTLNVRQGVLLEVWDSDVGKQDDFLGECWVPPLGSIGPRLKRFVLPLQAAPAEAGATRYHSKKMSKVQVDGHLVIEASWTMEEPAELKEGASLEERVEYETTLHTGTLKLKIIKAENLRGADSTFRRGGSDPYVKLFVKNEAFLGSDQASIPQGFDKYGWHQTMLNRHTEFWTTSVKKATKNPEWNEEKDFTLQTGAFEKRVHQSYHLSMSSGAAERRKDDHNLAVIGAKEELRIHFGPEKDAKKEFGSRHGVQVFLGENMHQFKEKLKEACLGEAQKLRDEKDERLKDPKKRDQLEAFAKNLSYRHVVMVFVPSQRLRELAQQGKTGMGSSNSSYEYKRLYRIEEQDPSSWQPLDQVCPFSHYAAMYSFGRNVQQRLRISDGTDQYKQKNNRLRLFDSQQKKYTERLEDLNNENRCFGYAQYVHKDDFNSTEWRPVVVDRQDNFGGTATKRKYQVSFVHTPLLQKKAVEPPTTTAAATTVVPGAGAAKTATPPADPKETIGKYEIEEDAVVLSPQDPKILISQHREHQELLSRAKVFKDQLLDDKAIVIKLNEELNRSWAKSSKEESKDSSGAVARPPAITLTDVQGALKRAEAQAETAPPPTLTQ